MTLSLQEACALAGANPEVAKEVVFWVVYDALPFIDWKDISNPSKEHYEAIFARQLMIFILTEQFDLPKRNTCKLFGVRHQAQTRAAEKLKPRMACQDRFYDFVMTISQEFIEKLERAHKNIEAKNLG